MTLSTELPMQDSSLVQALQSGDRTAFKMLVESYQHKVVNTCFGFVQNQEDAEDLAQEVFIEVHHSVGKFRSEAQLGTWLYRIAVNKSLELIRSRKRKKRWAYFQGRLGLDAAMTAPSRDVEDHPGVKLENKERARVLFQAIGQLAEKQRVAFTLHKVEGLSYQEICEVMNLSLSSVESLIHRAKKKLKILLADYYQKHEKG